jgi:hypothetical protein
MISFKVLEHHHNLYVIFNIYDNVVSPYNFSLYATIRVYGRFGLGVERGEWSESPHTH